MSANSETLRTQWPNVELNVMESNGWFERLVGMRWYARAWDNNLDFYDAFERPAGVFARNRREAIEKALRLYRRDVLGEDIGLVWPKGTGIAAFDFVFQIAILIWATSDGFHTWNLLNVVFTLWATYRIGKLLKEVWDGKHRKAYRDHRDRATGGTQHRPGCAAGLAQALGASGVACTCGRTGSGAAAGLTVAQKRLGPSLPESVSIEPIKGWKGGDWVLQGEDILLKGRWSDDGYGVEATAKCEAAKGSWWSMLNGQMNQSGRFVAASSPDHRAPDPDCSCGFHITKDRAEADRKPLTFEVELYGRVIAHERGYRGEKQRVLRVILGGCDNTLCRAAATTVLFDDNAWVGLCKSHAGAPAVSSTKGQTYYSLAEIAQKIGTEVVSETT